MNVNGFEVRDGILDLSRSSITDLESKAFLSARSVREVWLPAGLSHIGDWAFAKCTNLRKVKFADDFRSGMFGKEVFRGCDMLESIEFADSDPQTSALLALTANKLAYDHLLRSDDVGQKSWYEKWDISLVAKLKSDDAEAKMSAALCGEEDISYDGIGSVDGEMPGETEDFVKKEEYKKCSLCYIRLANDKYLGDKTREVICDHIINNRFGEGSGYSFFAIFEECKSDLGYLQIYLDTVKPDKHTIKDMINAISSKDVYAKSFLIGQTGSAQGALDDLML